MVVVFTEARAEGRQGRHKGRKAQAIQEEDKTRGKATDKKAKLYNWPVKPTNQTKNVKTRFLLRC